MPPDLNKIFGTAREFTIEDLSDEQIDGLRNGAIEYWGMTPEEAEKAFPYREKPVPKPRAPGAPVVPPVGMGEPVNPWPKVGTKGLKPGEPLVHPNGVDEASEQTISVGFDGREYLIPSVVIDKDGYLMKVSNEEAVRLFRDGKNPAVGVFDTPEQATEFAKKRSAAGGRFSGVKGMPRKPFSEVKPKYGKPL